MRVERLLWDDENMEHIARHGVNPEEVEDVCFGFHFIRKERDGIYILSGQSATGRYLTVIIEGMGRGAFRPKTAFDMSENYKRSYRRRLRKAGY